ncbi:S8 family peptidase [Streptomyces sp. NPDC003691]
MHIQRQPDGPESSRRRRAFGTTAALAAAALTLGTAGPAPAVPTPPAVPPAALPAALPAAGQEPAAGAADRSVRTVTLLTGDRVRIDGRGEVLGVERAEGRGHIPVRVVRRGDRTHAVPLDAERLITAGKLDRDLFDITALSRPEALAAYRDGLKVIVTYAGPSAAAAKAGVRGAEGTAVRRSLPTLNAEALTASPADPGALWRALTAGPGDGARATAATAGVAKIWLDGVVKASLDRTTRQIGAPAAWNRSYDGTGVTIAVLDTGIDDTHPDLAGRVRAAANFTGAPDTRDIVGHGTHVASIAAGTGAKDPRYQGVAPGAALLNGKVLNDWGKGYDSVTMAGIEWAAAQGADIVNMSLGNQDRAGTGPLEALINRLSEQKGILFAVAAGNTGPGEATVDSPGSAEAALTVGAVDDNDTIADFSARGPRLGDQGIKPDVTAPGVGVTAAAATGAEPQNPPGYITQEGTSMAAPHAAGAAALLKQQHPDWTGARLKAALMGSAKPGTGSPYIQGAGRIAVDRAVGQSVFAETGSLSLGALPRSGDAPATAPASRKLTYRNSGPADITLDLAVTGATGPGGATAPAGLFSLGAPRITVPAGGTAAVDVTADTRGAGAGEGGYAATVTATAGELGIRTPVAVTVEGPAHSVTIRTIARDGAPDPYAVVAVHALTGPARGQTFEGDWSTGSTTLRLPEGRYAVDHFTTVDGDERKGADQVLYPNLEVAGDTAIVLDARTARPTRITVPGAAGQPVAAAFHWGLEPYGYAAKYLTGSPSGLRTAHAGPPSPDGDRPWQGWIGFWQETRGGTVSDYRTVHYAQSSRFADGLTKEYRPGDFARVSVGLGASAPGRTGKVSAVGAMPTGQATGVWVERKVPGRYEVRLAGNAGTAWGFNYDQLAKPGDPGGETYFYAPDRSYAPGPTAYRIDFNTAVHGPRPQGWQGVYRDGDAVYGRMPFFTDGSGHIGDSRYASARTTLRQGARIVDEKADDLNSDEPLTVPAAAGTYTLTTVVSRPAAIARAGARITGSWTFTTARTEGETPLPVSTVRFAPAVALDSTAPAGRKQTFPVAVEGAAADGNLRSLGVSVSYDDGKTWRKVPVKQGKVTIANPAKGKGLALRGRVTDRQGNLSVITVHQAYLGR